MGYWSWTTTLRGRLNVHAVAFPGREQRLREAPERRLDSLVPPTGAAIVALADRPLVVFGHSFGALVAYEVLRREFAAARLTPSRVHFIASGRLPPHRTSKTPRMSHLPPRDIVFRIAKLYGNIPPALLEEPDYVDMMGRALQADLQINEEYLWEERPPLPCPITAVGGLSDPAVSPEDLRGWAQHTCRTFGLHLLNGDHFYFRSPTGQSALMDIVLACATSLAKQAEGHAQ